MSPYILLFLLAFGILIVMRTIARWRVNLFGKNSRMASGGHEYIFAIQNGEDRPLQTPFALEILIDDRRNGFQGTPEVYCGPPNRVASVVLDEGRRRLVLESNSLPALDTWLIRFQSRAHPSNVSLRFGPAAPRPGARVQRRPWPMHLQPAVLRQASGEESEMLGKTPRVRLLAGTILVLLVAYLFPLLPHGTEGIPLAHQFSPLGQVDLIVALLLVIVPIWVFHLFRIEALPIVQGYLEPFPLRLEPRSGSQELTRSGDTGASPGI